MKAQNSSCFTRLNPARLFEPVSEFTIDNDRLTGSTAEPKRLSRESIKVLSWNIARSNYSQHWPYDCRVIVEQHQPDLVFLQEVCLREKTEEISELIEMGWSFAPNFISTLDASYSGILVAAKADWLHSKALLSQHYEPIANTSKVSLFVEYPLLDSSESLLAVNIHAINFVGLDKFKDQLQKVESILTQHRGAIIFAGDFNTWNRARWRSLHQMTARLSLKAVTFPPEESRHLKRFLRSPPLDYIFYRGFSQKPSSARVIDTPTSSDHNPLLVELCGW